MGWTTHPIGDQYTFHTWEDGEENPVLYLHGFEGHPGSTGFLEDLAASGVGGSAGEHGGVRWKFSKYV
jgi:hypothetical protein